jgi:hypothetical protein
VYLRVYLQTKATATTLLAHAGSDGVMSVMLAAIVLYHMADYWAFENAMTYKTLRSLHVDLIRECPDFLWIRDVADASKHDQLTEPAKILRRMSSSDQVTRPPGLFEAPFGTAVLGEASIVTATLDNGNSRPLLGVVQSVIDMWEAKVRAAEVTTWPRA